MGVEIPMSVVNGSELFAQPKVKTCIVEIVEALRAARP